MNPLHFQRCVITLESKVFLASCLWFLEWLNIWQFGIFLFEWGKKVMVNDEWHVVLSAGWSCGVGETQQLYGLLYVLCGSWLPHRASFGRWVDHVIGSPQEIGHVVAPFPYTQNNKLVVYVVHMHWIETVTLLLLLDRGQLFLLMFSVLFQVCVWERRRKRAREGERERGRAYVSLKLSKWGIIRQGW